MYYVRLSFQQISGKIQSSCYPIVICTNLRLLQIYFFLRSISIDFLKTKPGKAYMILLIYEDEQRW